MDTENQIDGSLGWRIDLSGAQGSFLGDENVLYLDLVVRARKPAHAALTRSCLVYNVAK